MKYTVGPLLAARRSLLGVINLMFGIARPVFPNSRLFSMLRQTPAPGLSKGSAARCTESTDGYSRLCDG